MSQDLTCPHCDHEPFKAKTGLGSHLRTHGIKGSSSTTLSYRKAKAKAQAATQAPASHTPKRKYAKRSKALAIQATNGHIVHPHAQQETSSRQNYEIPEKALDVAYGRFLEFCRNLAYECDLPEKLFTGAFSLLIARINTTLR